MGAFFVYILKSAICMVAFYLFYKMLLSKDTFHRFNRFALLGILVGSFVLPTVNVQSHIQQEATNVLLDLGSMMAEPFGMIESNVEEDTFHWASVLLLIYIIGVVCFWAKHLFAMGSLLRLIRTGKKVRREDGTILVLYTKEIAPFSWMHYIVISEKDLDNNFAVLIHTASGAVAGSADAAAVKTAKMAMTRLIPVVGGILGDASETVLAGASALRGTVGAAGMLTVLTICLEPFLHLAVHYGAYKVTAALCALVAQPELSRLIDAIGGAFGIVLGMTGAAALILLISIVSAVTAVIP